MLHASAAVSKMESLQRLAHPLFLVSITNVYSKDKFSVTPFRSGSAFHFHETWISISRPGYIHHRPESFPSFVDSRCRGRGNTFQISRAGWFLGLGEKKQVLPDIVKAGDPVLHEAAEEVPPEEIGSERLQNIIDNMIGVMRKAPGVGLAAPQIGIPLKIIVLEDTAEYISYAPEEVTKAQDRHPFDLLVIINPKLKKKGSKSALFFEGCLSIDGFRAAVERHLEVEVTGLDRNGQAVRLVSSGWQARILQHECDHLEGYLYVDKMVPKTFRTAENLELPLATGCPKLGVRS